MNKAEYVIVEFVTNGGAKTVSMYLPIGSFYTISGVVEGTWHCKVYRVTDGGCLGSITKSSLQILARELFSQELRDGAKSI
jgi:hypothetical protein